MTRLPWTLVVLAALAAWPQKLPAQEQSLDQQLYRHAWKGNAEEVARLLKAGANPNATFQGMRPLHKAATEGHAKVLRLLIDHGAEVNVKDSSGRSPLLEAAGSRNPQAVALLLAAGAKPDGSELGHACWLNRTEAVDLLLAAGAPPDGGLAQAAQGGHVDLVKLLLDKGAKVSAPWKDGHTPLHLGALQGGYKTVELLLARGSDVNAVDHEGNTPLHMAVSGDCKLETIKLLVESGAKLNIANHEGRTPVRIAALHHDKTVYDWLVGKSGGKEPAPARGAAPAGSDQSTADLVALLATAPRTPAQRAEQRVALRELVLRGKEIMPAVLTSIETGTSIERFYELFVTMGPQAEAAIPLLQSRLDDKRQVLFAVLILERMQQGTLEKLPPPLREKTASALYEATLDAESAEAGGMPARALINLGEISQPYVLKLLRSDRADMRRVTASCLAEAQFSTGEIQAELIRLLQEDPDRFVRMEAVRALRTFGPATPELKAALLAIITQPPPFGLIERDEAKMRQMNAWREIAERSARSLARFGPEVIEDLVPFLSPIELPARFPAITTLQTLGEPGVPRLIELLDHQDPAVAISAAVVLTKPGMQAVPALAEAVASGSEQAADHAANALWWIGGGAKQALPTLYEVVQSDARPVAIRTAAARAALRIDPAASRQAPEILAAIPLLIRMLDRGSFRQQGYAAEALKDIGPAALDALPSLRKRLELPPADVDTGGLVRDYVRNAARDAIAAIEKPPEE